MLIGEKMFYERIPEKYYDVEKAKSYLEDDVGQKERLERFHYQNGFKDGFEYAHDFIVGILDCLFSLREERVVDCDYLLQVYTQYPEAYHEAQTFYEKYGEYYYNDDAADCVCEFAGIDKPELHRKY